MSLDGTAAPDGRGVCGANLSSGFVKAGRFRADPLIVVAAASTTLTCSTPESDRDIAIQRILRSAREYLGVQIAFVSQLTDGERVFRYVDAEDGVSIVSVGGRDPAEESYCYYVVRGELPEFLPDPGEHPVSAGLAATAAVGVGTHLSVPIRLSDGEVFGTFCCFALSVDEQIQPKEIDVVRMFAALVADYIEVISAEERDLRRRRDQMAVLVDDPNALLMVFQPVVDLLSDRVIGVEALARFPEWTVGPQAVFAEAWAVGFGVALELKAVKGALASLPSIPAPIRLGVNVSPITLVDGRFLGVVEAVPPGRLAVEVTEHAAVVDYDALRAARDRLAARDVRLAIDDVGQGFSGIHHIIECGPQTLKIDAAVVRDVHTNPAKLAMIEALVAFGRRLDVLVIAEGIETADELRALRHAGVAAGQGYYLGRPGQLVDLRLPSLEVSAPG